MNNTVVHLYMQASRYVSNGSRRGSFETSEDGSRDVRV